MIGAISVEHVSKRFRIPLDHGPTLQYRFSHPVSSSRYRELLALDDVSFGVRPGEFLGITGSNGCGKSTLLKILSRIYDCDSGRVKVHGRVSPFLELGVGFKQELTARENIYLGGAVMGLGRGQVATREEDVLEFAELTEFGDQKLKNFSSGMAVRLAFAVAMLADADILLLDEVLAVGDARFQEKCFDVFAQYKRQNRTILLVSHNLEVLELYCDRVILMDAGRVSSDGPPMEVVSHYRRLVAAMSEGDAADTDAVAESAPERRWGSREIEITQVRLVDGSGTPRHSFLTGEQLSVELDYVSHSLAGAYTCGISFRRSDGLYLAGPHTRVAPPVLPPVTPGRCGTITLEVPSLPFLSASYLLTVSLWDDGGSRPYDYMDDLIEFRVSDVEGGRLGMVDIGARWAHAFRDAAAGSAGPG